MRKQNWRKVLPLGTLVVLSAAFPVLGGTAAAVGGQGPGTVSPTGVSGPPGPATWSRVSATGQLPPARDAQWMVYDTASKNIVVFGGKGTRSHYFNDMWAYSVSAETWTRLSPAGTLPIGRFGHGMAYDSSQGKILVFGGVLGTTGQPAGDTWAYNSGNSRWAQSAVTGDHPAARVYPSMTFDQATGTGVLFGGWTGTAAFADTWSYDPSTSQWTRVATAGAPSARWGASVVYDSATGKIILFGGLFGSYDGTNRLADTWSYDPVRKSWTNLKPAGPVPPARGYAATVYDPAINRVILFGGFAGPQGLLADTWAYNPTTNRWSQVASGHPGPSQRDFSSMAYDQASGDIVLFGGQTGSTGNVNPTDLNDTWVLRF
jgi:N-acetylneuraminic acid mutarotase